MFNGKPLLGRLESYLSRNVPRTFRLERCCTRNVWHAAGPRRCWIGIWAAHTFRAHDLEGITGLLPFHMDLQGPTKSQEHRNAKFHWELQLLQYLNWIQEDKRTQRSCLVNGLSQRICDSNNIMHRRVGNKCLSI